MSSILFIGIVAIFVFLLFKNSLMEKINVDYKMIQKMKHATWFQSHWRTGVFLFFINAVLFFLVGFILYLLAYFIIPFVHVIIMLLAVIVSVCFWMIISKSWQGSKANRFKVGLVGSSFYIILSLVFVYRLMTLKPSYPGEDTFMESIGLIFGIIVTMVAFITCFIIIAFPKSNNYSFKSGSK
ncbi:hypothetical protein ABEV55_10410 [Aneurinibacillus thermoaerophilus]|uniref:hypothetical protein n=1 Tax=Aneurinibacillus thermoaerophilus TaxID=143495 RepID=UPI002E2067AE|nr:hypothetical protein [Aneurinibacillus thermoaerophilus]